MGLGVKQLVILFIMYLCMLANVTVCVVNDLFHSSFVTFVKGVHSLDKLTVFINKLLCKAEF